MNNTILVIDDQRATRENVAEILELSNYNVVSASEGKEGIELAKVRHPDLILCDIMMPVLDGYGVLRAMQNNPDLASIPFIFLTGETEKNDFRTAMDLGADDYITKPFSGDALLKVVNGRLTKNRLLKETFSRNFEGLRDFMDKTKSFHNLHAFSEKQNIRKFKKKEFIFNEGDQSEYLYFIIKGKIKVYKTNYWGKEYITDIYKEGDFFGYLSLIDTTDEMESAMAIDDSEVLLISKQDFFGLLHSDHEVSAAFIKMLAGNLTEAGEKLMKLAYDSARKKVSEALIYISKKYQITGNNEVTFPVHRENISAIAGLSPESVSRNLTDFRHEGLIDINKGSIKILDFKKLESLKW